MATPPTGPLPMGSTNTVFIIDPWFDISYLTSKPGIIKATVVVLNILTYICVQSSAFWSNGRGVYFILVSLIGFLFSGSLLGMYLYHIVEKYHNVKWLKIELVGCVVLTFLNLIAASVAVGFGSSAFSAAGFFGYLAMMAYGLDAFLKAKALKNDELPQGRRVVARQGHIASPTP